MKRLVIIGGGFAGSTIARELEGKFSVVLIDSKDYFEFTPGVLRTIVEPEHIKRIQRLHRDYLKKTKIVLGSVSDINRKYVFVNNEKILFDYLVIASGSRYNVPFKESKAVVATRSVTLKNCYDELCRAKNVLIVGGGLVGVELAGEICTHYKDKKIVIVHAKDKLIDRNHEKAIKHAENFLRKKGVKIIFNERIIKFDKNFISNKGKKYRTGISFLCTGIVPNSSFLMKNFSDSLTHKGFIKVNEYLQLEGEKGIFAVGDVNDRMEEKTAQNAERQAKIAVKNICALEHEKSLEKYHSKKTPLVISLGRWNGIYSQGSFVFTGLIPGLMKRIIEWKEMIKLR